MIKAAQDSNGNTAAPAERGSNWHPLLTIMLIIFLLSLTAWGIFFKLGSEIETKRLQPEQVQELINKQKQP